MLFKGKKIRKLSDAIEVLNDKIEESNIEEWLYVLGQKKEIIKRNLLARYI